MLLKNKNAIIYGAGGSLGGAIAKAFALAGARVLLTGRNLAPLQKIADEIKKSGGQSEIYQLDAMNENAINENLEHIAQKFGTIDISFNAVGVDVIQNIPLLDISIDDFVRPITLTMQTRFLTAKAAGKMMMKQESGVILFLTATPAGIGYPLTGGFAPACSAVESLSRNLASELGIYGIRVVSIRSGGSPDSKVFKDAIDANPDHVTSVIRTMENDTMLKELPLMDDIANVAVFLASGMAAKITGVTVDVTCGTTAALNYRTQQNGSGSETFGQQLK